MSALHIFSTRARVQKHNEMMLNSLEPSTHKVIQAITNIPSTVTPFDVDSSVCNIPNILIITQQARVIVVRSINVAEGLVNGSTGIVLDIIYEKNVLLPSLPKCIVVFDDPSC